MLVTIITDASFCQQTRAGGYGVWVASARGKQEFGGALRGTTDSGETEAKAVCNGVWHAMNSGILHKGDVLLIQTDCMGALQLLQRQRQPRASEKDVIMWFTKIVKDNDLKIRFRHVKGHTHKKDSRSKAQAKCDALAFKYMQKERGRLMAGCLQDQVQQAKRERAAEEKVKQARQLFDAKVKFKERLRAFLGL